MVEPTRKGLAEGPKDRTESPVPVGDAPKVSAEDFSPSTFGYSMAAIEARLIGHALAQSFGPPLSEEEKHWYRLLEPIETELRSRILAEPFPEPPTYPILLFAFDRGYEGDSPSGLDSYVGSYFSLERATSAFRESGRDIGELAVFLSATLQRVGEWNHEGWRSLDQLERLLHVRSEAEELARERYPEAYAAAEAKRLSTMLGEKVSVVRIPALSNLSR